MNDGTVSYVHRLDCDAPDFVLFWDGRIGLLTVTGSWDMRATDRVRLRELDALGEYTGRELLLDILAVGEERHGSIALGLRVISRHGGEE